MKQKLSISIEKGTIESLAKYIKEGRFRNKSHIIEYSLNKFLNEEKNDQPK